jgi:GntR family transcriptional regulator
MMPNPNSPVEMLEKPQLRRAASLGAQIADFLRDRILSGEWEPGRFLPAEEALAADLGVSRSPVRDAMSRLEAEGLIVIQRPRGTYVRDAYAPPPHTDTRTLTVPASTTHGGPDSGYSTPDDEVWTEVGVTDLVMEASSTYTGLLGIEPGTPILVREALHTAPGGSRRRVRTLVPFAVASELDTPWQGPLPPPGEVFGWFHHHGHQLTFTDHVRARMPVADETDSLTVPAGTPLLITTRVAYTSPGPGSDREARPVAAEETTTSAAAVQYAYPITPRRASARKTTRRR